MRNEKIKGVTVKCFDIVYSARVCHHVRHLDVNRSIAMAIFHANSKKKDNHTEDKRPELLYLWLAGWRLFFMIVHGAYRDQSQYGDSSQLEEHSFPTEPPSKHCFSMVIRPLAMTKEELISMKH